MCSHDPEIPTGAPDTPDAPRGSGDVRITRRGLFGAVAAGIGVYGLGRLPAAANSSAIQSLEEPGLALEAADRLPHPIPTTTTTEPPPPAPIDPPAEGEILFPILVGADDSCYVLDNFGDCRGSGCSRSHEAVDIMADEGLPIVSVCNGVITKRYDDRGLTSGAGNGWTIHDEENDVFYKYFHMRDHAEGLEEGDTVEIGQVIGTVGETGTSGAGNPSNNFHCHFEYRPGNGSSYDGVAVDPYHLQQRPEHVTFQNG